MWHKIICYIFASIFVGVVYNAHAFTLPVSTGAVVQHQTFAPTRKSVRVDKASYAQSAQNNPDKNVLDGMSLQDFKQMIFNMLDWIEYFAGFLFVWTLLKRFLYLKSSALNRLFFVIDILLYHVISFVLIDFALQYTLDVFAGVVGFSLLVADYHFIKAWRACPKYPYQPDDNVIRTNENDVN